MRGFKFIPWPLRAPEVEKAPSFAEFAQQAEKRWLDEWEVRIEATLAAEDRACTEDRLLLRARRVAAKYVTESPKAMRLCALAIQGIAERHAEEKYQDQKLQIHKLKLALEVMTAHLVDRGIPCGKIAGNMNLTARARRFYGLDAYQLREAIHEYKMKGKKS